MYLLGTDAYRFALASSLIGAQKSLSVVSAYVTTPGIEWVLDRLNSSVSSCRVLARWDPNDLVSGASDLEAFDRVRRIGGRFFVLPNLHAKLILVDNKQLFVGSANVTGLGLKLVPGANQEIGVTFTASSHDVSTVDVMFAEAIEITPILYNEFLEHVQNFIGATRPTMANQWPAELARKLHTRPQKLWVAELLWSAKPQTLIESALKHELSEAALHDISLLGLEADMLLDHATLAQRFLNSRPWGWLLARLLEENSHELSFGRLSELLHNALIDDPKPYRKDVKQLVANLLGWVQEFGRPTAIIDRSSYSERVALAEQLET